MAPLGTTIIIVNYNEGGNALTYILQIQSLKEKNLNSKTQSNF